MPMKLLARGAAAAMASAVLLRAVGAGLLDDYTLTEMLAFIPAQSPSRCELKIGTVTISLESN